ncbi:hypothetical protein [Synechococcus sp. BSF8S]|uniref:terminase gpP N-terminus-related DNA-binding protein n=2 Tax=Cyanophyceae TaxID=3028117 RepID=UPI001C899DAC|nr:hypothetical protein [Synechococcus sp. BSF8S]
MTPQMRQAARLYADGYSQEKIAERLSIRQKTVSNWATQCPLWQQEVTLIQAQLFHESNARTLKLANVCIPTLGDFIADPNTPPQHRLAAIGLTLQHARHQADHALRVRQAEALEQRIAAIEALQEQQAIDIEHRPVHELASGF